MRTSVAAVLFVLLTGGCAGGTPGLPADRPQSGATSGAVETAASPAPPSKPTHSVPTQSGVAVVDADRPPPASASRPAGPSGTQTDSRTAKTPAKTPASPAPIAQLPKKENVAPTLAKQKASPPLDLASLEKRLKETPAIGVMTKLALKNQVDDLLNRFRAFYQGRSKSTLAELRQPYELLLLKVLSLLQDADPPLAGAIAASREAIWSVLADPAKFAKI